MWTLLIQCRLVGKAIKVYNALDDSVARDYHRVKSIVLKAYDLVPEAYRLKFRNSVKTPTISFVEFARMKREQFYEWLKSRQVISVGALKELILLEEFKKACGRELRVHLEEVKADTLDRAAQIADEFVLTHKSESRDFQARSHNNPDPRSPDNTPLVKARLVFPGYDRVTELAVVDILPVPNIDGILGNDMLDEKGHFGVGKTFKKLAENYWWPGMKSSVKKFVKSCEICQVMGKPNQPIPKAPLNPIPAIGEPFSELVIDVVGPLPKTKTGFMYILTIMDRASRFPEAFPMRSITSKIVFDKLVEYFSRYGLPRVIQTDCGTNFTSKVFRGKCAELAIQHITSVPYHPESQGVVERFHQTLKTIIKKYCYGKGNEWDKALPFALFAIRNHPNASTGVAPFELIFGHKIRGPLEVLGEILRSEQKGKMKIGEFMDGLRNRLNMAWEFAKENLSSSQMCLGFTGSN
ncbi:protein NYNRIN-like [Macrobrachium rosenbergii]|uniref:protein NYNRIN-like n=1 Tax=Macrobrachium rosenbergii TaxID=79674 RepID=UPI0034D6666F